MPRSRGLDVPPRLSPRAPLHLKTTACSEVNGVHRPVDRSPKLEDRRSPRILLHEKKRVTRVVDLETKLGIAQEELKKLRDQLASAEVAKLDAEQALEKAKKQIPALAAKTKEIDQEENYPLPKDYVEASEQQQPKPEEESISSSVTTDVFEVVVPNDQAMSKDNEDESKQKEEEKTVEEKEEETETVVVREKVDDADANANDTILVEKKDNEEEEFKLKKLPEISEMVELKAKLVEKEKEVEILLEENAIFKIKAKAEADSIAAAARAREEKLAAKLRAMEEELKECRAKAERLEDQLEAAEKSKAMVEADMKRLKVQTDQWRKAAEAAAAVLATGDGTGTEMRGRRVTERCGSMDKHLAGGYVGWGSPLMAGDMEEDGMMMGGARRKGAGIRMFGDLWKKKGQQK